MTSRGNAFLEVIPVGTLTLHSSPVASRTHPMIPQTAYLENIPVPKLLSSPFVSRLSGGGSGPPVIEYVYWIPHTNATGQPP
jgi:hypothetical protein